MGILNVTPDSFSDGGSFSTVDGAVDRALEMIAEGADVIDVGGESTRPGARAVANNVEIGRVVPVIAELARQRPDVGISIDTVKSEVAAAALDAGAHAVNDVSGLRLDPRIGAICAKRRAGLVVMHSRGDVFDMATFQQANYTNFETEMFAELRERVDAALQAGVAATSIVVDPGIGFSKRREHSLAALRAIPQLVAWGHPVLIGASRKRFIGDITGVVEPRERIFGTLGAHLAALTLGARIFRVHDVRAHRQALDVAWAVMQRES